MNSSLSLRLTGPSFAFIIMGSAFSYVIKIFENVHIPLFINFNVCLCFSYPFFHCLFIYGFIDSSF